MNDKSVENTTLKDSFQDNGRVQDKRPIVTKAERDKLASELDRPTKECIPTPDGTVTRNVNQQVSELKNHALNYMDRRLNRIKNRARDNFNRTQQCADSRDR